MSIFISLSISIPLSTSKPIIYIHLLSSLPSFSLFPSFLTSLGLTRKGCIILLCKTLSWFAYSFCPLSPSHSLLTITLKTFFFFCSIEWNTWTSCFQILGLTLISCVTWSLGLYNSSILISLLKLIMTNIIIICRIIFIPYRVAVMIECITQMLE